ncbi:uncharacterized protein JCM15063_004191 [Sporobolomyces koalae]|uniref:uncharacterized protein n=1 Tax=Sporobolomyces koalae TaxID=500713 RepID=UPI0031799C72
MARYALERDADIQQRREAVDSVSEFTQSKMTRSNSAPTLPPVDPRTLVPEEVRKRSFVHSLKSFDRELLSTVTGGETPICEAETPSSEAAIEERTRERLHAVSEQLKRDQQLLQARVAEHFDKTFEKHLAGFDHDIHLLSKHLFDSYHYILDANGGEFSEQADKRILLGGRQAYELDKILLTEYYFKELAEQLREGPEADRNVIKLAHALSRAEDMAHRLATTDKQEHSCTSSSDPDHAESRCQGCHRHAHRLYLEENNLLHEEILKLRLYRRRTIFSTWDSDAGDAEVAKTLDDGALRLNADYWFAALACEVVDKRRQFRQHAQPRERTDLLQRSAIVLRTLHGMLHDHPPATLISAQELYDNCWQICGTVESMSATKVEEFFKQVEKERRDGRVPLDNHYDRHHLPALKHTTGQEVPASSSRLSHHRQLSGSNDLGGHTGQSADLDNSEARRVDYWLEHPDHPAVPRPQDVKHARTKPRQCSAPSSIPSPSARPIQPKPSWKDLRRRLPIPPWTKQRAVSPDSRSDSSSASDDSSRSTTSRQYMRGNDSAYESAGDRLDTPRNRKSSCLGNGPSSAVAAVPPVLAPSVSRKQSSGSSSRGRTGIRDFAYEEPHRVAAFSPSKRPRGRSASVHRSAIA